MQLIEIGQLGDLAAIVEDDFIASAVEATLEHYGRVGFAPPWIGYVGLRNQTPVGVCGFKGRPREQRVEIAYGTAPGLEGQGIATAMARELVRIAQVADPQLTILAQTLPVESASTTILTRLGFEKRRVVDHPEDGPVWEWELPPLPS
ncbi:MAG: GNAT family N-acetyltransferase [Planctomycetales bacterium]|nr:GNAT family N-acetyltransferase [Planctomycetales bacterium]